MPFELTTPKLRQMLDELASQDTELAAAVSAAGYPRARRSPQGFATLLRIVVGQQLSTQAAAAIYSRLQSAAEISPSGLLSADERTLREVGLSRRKVEYSRGLAAAMLDGTVNPWRLARASDEQVSSEITQLRGFGPWSAEMYLLFSLGRADIWPVNDLAIQKAVTRFKGFDRRLTPDALRELGQRWRPLRSAVALFAWHYLKNPPT